MYRVNTWVEINKICCNTIINFPIELSNLIFVRPTPA